MHRLAQLRVTCLALLSVQLIALLALALALSGRPTGPEQVPYTADALPLLALAAALLIAPLRRAFMGGLALPFSSALTPPPADADAPLSERDAADALVRARSRYFTGTVLGQSLAAGVTLVGLLHGWLTDSLFTPLPYLAVGLGLGALQLPARAGLATLMPPAARALLDTKRDYADPMA